jgi:hypothetical protein
MMLRGGAATLVSLGVAGACLVAARESGRALPAYGANGAAALRPGLPYEIAVDGVPLPRVAPRWELRQYPVVEPQQVARVVLPAAVPVPVAAVSSQPAIDVEYAWIAAETPQLLTVSLPNVPLPALTGEPGVSPTQSLALTLLRHRNLTGFSVVWPSDAPTPAVAEELRPATEAAPLPPGWLTQAWVSPAPLHAAKAAALASQPAAVVKPAAVVTSGSQNAAVAPAISQREPSSIAQAEVPVSAVAPDATTDSDAGGTAADIELSAGPQAGQAVPRARGSRRAHRRDSRTAAVRWPPRAVVRSPAKPAAVRFPPVRLSLPKPVVVRPVVAKPVVRPVAKPVFKAAPKPPVAVSVKKVVQRPPPRPVKVFVAKPKPVVTKPKPAKPPAAPVLPRWTTN